MNILIVKLGATGDVVRTTPLLEKFRGDVAWITAAKNLSLLKNLRPGLHALTWEERDKAVAKNYDLVINLEDTPESCEFVKMLKFAQLFGAFLGADGKMTYTEDSRDWFDLSLISRFGKEQADKLKLENRRTYQDLVFNGLGFKFSGEKYILPAPAKTDLHGDVAIAPKAGAVWPMKNWAYYADLKRELEARKFIVNVLPERATLLEHLGDCRNHRVIVSGDSLPMHFALGVGTRCVSLFTCTSPWEIHGYGIMRKITSPLLAEFFFKRGMDERAIKAISLDEVLAAVLEQVR